MAFSNPIAFLLLFFIPILPLLRSVGVLKYPALYAILCDWGDTARSMTGKIRRTVSAVASMFTVLCYVCTVIAAAGPVTIQQEKVYQSLASEVMFIVDTSPSMAARDIDGKSRLEAAKQAIMEVTEKMGGAAIGLTALASEAAVVVPATCDRTTFLERLSSLTAGYMGSGTAIGTALATAACHIANSSAQNKCCVLVTDGESNEGFINSERAAQLLRKENVALYVLGIGTSGIVPLEYTDPVSGKLYRGTLESHFDPTVLKRVASEGGGRYFSIQRKDELISVLLDVSRSVALTQSYFLKTETADKSTLPLLLATIFAVIAWLCKRLLLKEVL